MGHATRSAVVLEHLLGRGHEIRVVVSGRAHGFLREAFADRAGIVFAEITGLTLDFDDDGLDLSRSILTNLAAAPGALLRNLASVAEVAEDGFRAEVVVSDFESWAYFYGRSRGIPVISIDNMQILNRCEHPPATTDHRAFDFRLAKLAVKAKLPGAYHYLITSFFFPPVRKPRTTLVPEKRAELFAFAHRAAWGRIYGGVHFPSDLVGAWTLAEPFVLELKKSADFRARVEKCRVEVAAFAKQ